MTIQIFLMLLTLFATITTLATEGIKDVFNKENIKYSSNLVALVVAVVVAIGGMLIYSALNDMQLNMDNIIYSLLMAVANWLGSMVGYDKVKQFVQQIKGV